jgi:hypothetical protein
VSQYICSIGSFLDLNSWRLAVYKDMSGVRRSAGAGHPLLVIGGVELALVIVTEDFVIPGPQLTGVST